MKRIADEKMALGMIGAGLGALALGQPALAVALGFGAVASTVSTSMPKLRARTARRRIATNA